MLTRRDYLAYAATGSICFVRYGVARATPNQSSAMVELFAAALVACLDGSVPAPEQEARLRGLVNANVDTKALALFCLGRFVGNASSVQLDAYEALFHDTLIGSITGQIGNYRGVTFTLGATRRTGDDDVVTSVVQRPGQRPNNVSWIVGHATGQPRIVDIVVEGTSLRLVKRSECESFLLRHDGSVDLLIEALRTRQQAFAPGDR